MGDQSRSEHFSVNDFGRYQHYKKRNPPWIKLYNSLLNDFEFVQLKENDRYLYIGLLLLASRLDNHIPNEPEFLSRLLHCREPVNLTALFDMGFLIASRKRDASKSLADFKQIATPETETETKGEADTSNRVVPRTTPNTPRGTITKIREIPLSPKKGS